MVWKPPGPGRWTREVAHFPVGQTPLYRAIYERESAEGLRQTNERYGVPARTLRVAHVNHRLYARVVPLVEPRRLLSGRVPPRAAVWALTRLVPRIRARSAAARQAWETKLWRTDGERWYAEEGPAFEGANLTLGDEPVDDMSDDELRDHVRRALEHLAAGIRTHFFLVGAHVAPLGDYLAFAGETGITADQALTLVRGASPASVEGAQELQPLSEAVAARGEEPRSVDDLRALGGEAERALQQWMRRYGNRVVSGYDVDRPTFAELPQVVVGTVTALARRHGSDVEGGGGVGAGDGDAVRRLIPAADRARFDELLEEARYGYGVRDANSGLTLQWPAGLVRRALLAAARRMEKTGGVDRADDLFEATPTEVDDLLRGRGPARGELRGRATRRAALLAQPAPDALGPEEPIPPLDPLPAPLRRSARAGLLAYELMNTDPGRAPGTGTGIGTELVRGRARVAGDPDEALAAVEPGDILVVPATTPAYNALLPLLAGLVVEEGGLLSHAALVAREFGIPAVIGLRGATRDFDDGAVVELDPTSGAVRVLAPPN